jgi:hypothetical protein
MAPRLPVGAQALQVAVKQVVSSGWHPWYEIKGDRESPQNMIICGTKWDAQLNAPFGFIYASSDGGITWKNVLEDRNSTWVTEQSCAFGPNHRAYFISAASRVIDGNPHHELGTTRLYVSTDGGQHWIETIKTGWADWSTSAVSSASGRLYTFFNAYTTGEPGRNWGSNVGLLVFSPDGKNVTGPFFAPAIQDLGYQGAYPVDAVAVKSGAVVALWYGTRLASTGMESNLNLLRADQSPDPLLDSTPIPHSIVGKNCLTFNQSSLAYDSEHNRLFVVYVDGCDYAKIILTSSDDEGRTWTKGVVVTDPHNSEREITYPSLVVVSGDGFGVLWEESQGSGRWLFSCIRDHKLVEPPTELSSGPEIHQISNDSLLTWIEQSTGHQGKDPKSLSEPSITLNVHTELNNVWRGSGLTTIGDKIIAIWPSGDSRGSEMYSAVLTPTGSASNDEHFTDDKDVSARDVTQQSVILYGGTQDFDSATATLEVCLALGNRGDKPMRVPINLEAKEIRSSRGTVSITNSTNGLAGAGATWDISNSLTGNQIPPGASSNPFCLFFHLGIRLTGVLPPEAADLLILKIRVLASNNSASEPWKQSRN